MSLSLFLEGFGFEYAHFLPFDLKCSRLHGHSAKVRVKLFGKKAQDGMLLPFDTARSALKEAVSVFDHKLLVPKSVIENESKGLIELSYSPAFAPEAYVRITIPKESVLVTPKQTTIENIAELLAVEVSNRLPLNIEALELCVSEGNHKGVCLKFHRDPKGGALCPSPR